MKNEFTNRDTADAAKRAADEAREELESASQRFKTQLPVGSMAVRGVAQIKRDRQSAIELPARPTDG